MATFVYLCLVILTLKLTPADAARNKVILISFDGFRYDYLDKYKPPTLLKMVNEGVKSPYVVNTFVSKTYPGHVSISTGRYQESHGIVGNRFYDPTFNETFDIKKPSIKYQDRWWQDAEPIWIAATRQSVLSGTVFWPGSEVAYGGVRPEKWLFYNETFPFNQRMDTAIEWMTKDGLDFVVLYFHEPDKTGHKHGPDSADTGTAVKKVDDALNYLIEKLKSNNIYAQTNIIVTSDHGMILATPKKLIQLYGKLNASNVADILEFGPFLNIRPTPNNEMNYYEDLKRLAQSEFPNMKVFKKEEFPSSWHYKNNSRIPNVFALADEGYFILAQYIPPALLVAQGVHGYDPKYRSMNPIFIAQGPDFVKGLVTSEPIHQVDIYNLVAHLLKIRPNPNNGTWSRVNAMVTDGAVVGRGSGGFWSSSVLVSVGLVVMLLLN